MQPDYVFTNPPLITRAMQAEMLKHLALNWPATPTGFTADMVRDALNAGAEALTCAPAPNRTAHQVLAEEFGLEMKRFAADEEMRHVGVRVSHDNDEEVRKIWEVIVDRKAKNADVFAGGSFLFSVNGSPHVGACLVEKFAVRCLLKFLREKKRCCRAERNARRKEREADFTEPQKEHDTMSTEEKLQRVRAAYEHAVAKHPFFADAITCKPGPIAAREMAEWQMWNHEPKQYMAEYLLQEEIAEIIDAYVNGDKRQAVSECYDAIAVLMRMAETIESEVR